VGAVVRPDQVSLGVLVDAVSPFQPAEVRHRVRPGRLRA
jgi:hypothetical protein